MTLTARLLTPLAVIFLASACSHVAPGAESSAALQPSPNRLVGRILAVDLSRGFAFIELANDPPAAALAAGAELLARTDDLRETARLRASRYSRGRTLATTILSGQPSTGDEVVFRVP